MQQGVKRALPLILGLVACLLLAGVAYFWANGIMDSLYGYRSPLREHPPEPGLPLGEPLARRVVFVLVDALREDTSLRPEIMPFLNELREQGAWATMHSRPPSYSAPAYSVLFTGAWPDLSDGPALNQEYEEIPTWTQDDLVSALHRAGYKTALSAYYWFEKLVPQSSVSASYYTTGEDRTADRAVVAAALSWLEEGDLQFVFVHLDQVDYAGHYEGGPQDPRWDAAARRVDDLLREIVAALDLGQDTLLVASDHGQLDQGGHGGQDSVVLLETFVLVGAGVKPGSVGDVEMVDVAPTLATLLGASIPASSQGHVLTQMLDLVPGREETIERALETQQSRLLARYQVAIGQNALIEPQADTVAAHQEALETAQSARLNRERLPRAMVALIVILLPLGVIVVKRGRDLAWLVAAGVLYIVLFNLRYAVLDGRTYSLSSVASADELLLYCATTALLSLLVVWLLSMLILHGFGQGSRRASKLVLGLVLMIVYLLSLPVLWSFVLNGALITWTLPDMASMFLAFLSLIQILVVAVLGLLLAAVSAAAARFAQLKSG